MNDENKVNIEKKEINDIKVEGKEGKKHTLKIKQETVDITGKKNEEAVDISASLKEGSDGTPQDITLKGVVKIGWYSDSVVVKETSDGKIKLTEEQTLWSRRIHKPMLWVTIAAVVIALGGFIWWWIASSKNEDKEEESL